MCFGVRDALQALDQIESPRQTTIFGELVHNEQVNAALAARGFSMLQENHRDIHMAADNVVITAHGISDAERQLLRDAGKTLIDTTCPLVQRVHRTAQRFHAEGWFIVVIGQPQHVEVRGITGDLERFAVVSRPDEARDFNSSRLAVVCQTTARPALANQIISALGAANPSAVIRFADTICRPTRERQMAAEQLVQMVDAMVVVGGAHSNNTRQLVDLARQHGIPVAHVQAAAELQPDWFLPFGTVGLTAGTSTLQSTIDEVDSELRRIAVHQTAIQKEMSETASAYK